MNIRDTFREAMAILTEAEVDEDLRPVAFAEAVAALRASQGSTAPADGSARLGDELETGDDKSTIDEVARRMSVTREQIEEIYDFGDGEFGLVAPGTKIAKTNAAGTKEISLLVAAGRQAAGFDDYTKTEALREWCDHYGRLDPPNFAKTVASMVDEFRMRGKGANRQFKLRDSGWTKAKELVERLLSPSA